MPNRSPAECCQSAQQALPGVRQLIEPRNGEAAEQESVKHRKVPTFSEEWCESYGPTWLVDLACLGAVVFLLGAMQPLGDPDLPMHLATGEWIVRHGAVPFIEPFAWTRTGAPYYAYSWALEVVYYLLMSWWGPLGLHLLQGVMLLGAAAAMIALARAAGWKPWLALCMAALNVATAMLVVPALRPQLVLLTLVPLAWACTYLILTKRRIRWAVAALLVTSATAANSHLFFVLTAAPIALVLANPPADRRRGWAVCVAVLAGWFMSPYALLWPEVFRLNFGYNALLLQPSPIREFQSGFRSGQALLLALPLALIPWAMPRWRFRRRERMVHGGLWLAGLTAFTYAGRLLLCWWLIVLPVAASIIGHLGRNGRNEAPRPAVKLATYTIAFASLVTLAAQVLPRWRAEGDSTSRRLPVEASSAIEPLLVWLECNVSPGAEGRVYTWFNYGSYLVWRLPGYSASIDGRTIFPDSVAKVEMLRSGLLSHPEYHVWSSADLAIVPRYFGVAATLDTAQQWRLAATFRPKDQQSNSIGLWVKRSWWESVGAAPLAGQAAALSTPGDSLATATCEHGRSSRLWGARIRCHHCSRSLASDGRQTP